MTRFRAALAVLCLILGSLAASGQTVNLFNPAAVKTGGPYVPSDTSGTPSNSFSGYSYEVVNLRGFASVVPNVIVGANGGGNSSFVIPFFDANGNEVGTPMSSVAAGQCITVPTGAVSMGFAWNTGYAAASTVMLNDGCTVANSYIAFTAPPATISYTPPGDKAYNAAAFQLVASTNSSSPVVFSLAYGPATVSSSGLVTLSGQNGTVGVYMNVAADANYAAAQVGQTFNVTGAPVPVAPAISITGVSNHLYTDPSFTISVASNSSSPVVVSIPSGPATISGNVITLTGQNGIVTVQASTAAATGWLAGSNTATFIVYGAPVTGPVAGYTTVVAQHLGGDGAPVSNATLSFSPVSTLTNQAISFRAGGNGGPVVNQPITAQVVGGIAGPLLVPDTCLSSPQHVAYNVQLIDNVSGDSLLASGYNQVQPCGTTWSLDTYGTNQPTQATVSPGSPGESAYQLAVDLGYGGTQAQWLASLVGAAGQPGTAGQNGQPGATGQAGSTTATGSTGGFDVGGSPQPTGMLTDETSWQTDLPMLAFRAAVHNAVPSGNLTPSVVTLACVGDSICMGTGPTAAHNTPWSILRTYFPYSAGYGWSQPDGYPSAANGTLGTFGWQINNNSGTSSLDSTYGPAQPANGGQAIGTTVRLTGNAVAAPYVGQQADTLVVTGSSQPGDSGLDLTIDGSSTVLATVGANTGSAAAVYSTTVHLPSSGYHLPSLTPHGGGAGQFASVDYHLGNYGVRFENLAHGTARSDAFGSNVTAQLAYMDLLSPYPAGVVIELGPNDILECNVTEAAFKQNEANIITHIQGKNPYVSILLVDAESPTYNTNCPSGYMTPALLKADVKALAQQYHTGYVSFDDMLGSVANGQGLGLYADYIHPSDELARLMADVEYKALMGNTQPLNVLTPAVAPTGSCGDGNGFPSWAMSMDGHVSFCNGSSWVQKF